jgi:hypothetical protein
MALGLFRQKDIRQILDRFDVSSKGEDGIEHGFFVMSAELLSPDSGAVAILSDKFYVLYSEDFIDTLDGVRQEIERWFPSKIQRFIAPKKSVDFDDIVRAQYYIKIDMDKMNQWMPYAVDDDGNYAFLAEVEPTEQNACWWTQPKVLFDELPETVQKEVKHLEKMNDASKRARDKSFVDGWQEICRVLEKKD